MKLTLTQTVGIMEGLMICADVLFMSMVDGSDKNFVKRSVDLNVRVCEMRNHKMMFQQKCTPYTPSLHVLHMLDVLDIFTLGAETAYDFA